MKYAPFWRRRAHITTLFTCLLSLTACGDKSATPAHSGQWVAKVNDHEITVHQVNAELNSAGAAAAALPADIAQRRAVQSVVDRQLLVDAAVKAKQDRDPDVVQAIEQAKEQVIAQMYLRKKVGTNATPSQQEVSDYFNKHPELFSKRKQLDMRQIIVPKDAFNDEIVRTVDGARSLDDVEAALTAKNIAFKKNHALNTTTDLPPQMRESMNTLLSGKPFVIRTDTSVIVATMSTAGEAPLSLQEAAPQIAQYLANTRGRDAAAAEVARLRKEARIEYKPGYGPASDTTPAQKAAEGEKAATNDASSVDRAAAGLR